MHIGWSIAGWFLGTLLIAAGIAYLVDSLYIRYEVAGADSAAAFGNVRFYSATKQKDGKYIIFQDSPQNEVCVHALFPHYGYKPCWFASRKKVRVVMGPARDVVVDFFPEKFLSFEILHRLSGNEARRVNCGNASGNTGFSRSRLISACFSHGSVVSQIRLQISAIC